MTPRIGLYSISVRGLNIPDLLTWAAEADIPFVHLRGGTRGYHLTHHAPAMLRRWRRHSYATASINGLTTDLDIADLTSDQPATRTAARTHLHAMAQAAEHLGARWLRLLARQPLAAPPATARLPQAAVPLLVEPHHPHWLTPGPLAHLTHLLEDNPHLRILADTAQLAHALPLAGTHAEPALQQLMAHADVLHLSDQGDGLHHPGHAAVARAAHRRLAAGARIELAVEWTGAPRSPDAALTRHAAARQWWHDLTQPAHA